MYILWAAIGFIFIFLDFKKTNILKLVFANSFIFTSIVAYRIPKDYLIQTMSFLTFFGIFYFLIKQILKNEKKDIEKLKSNNIAKGTIATVVKDIGKTLSIDGLGAVEFDSQLWSAKSINDKEIKAGKKVEVVSRENLVLNVKVVE